MKSHQPGNNESNDVGVHMLKKIAVLMASLCIASAAHAEGANSGGEEEEGVG